MKIILFLILVSMFLLATSCVQGKTTTPIKTTPAVISNALEQQYQQAIEKMVSDGLTLSIAKADIENQKQVIAQEKEELNRQITNLTGELDNLRINYNNKILEYQQLAQTYANLQNSNESTIVMYNDALGKLISLKSLLLLVNTGTGLASANMTATEKTSFYLLFQKWYKNELPAWAK